MVVVCMYVLAYKTIATYVPAKCYYDACEHAHMYHVKLAQKWKVLSAWYRCIPMDIIHHCADNFQILLLVCTMIFIHNNWHTNVIPRT